MRYVRQVKAYPFILKAENIKKAELLRMKTEKYKAYQKLGEP